MYNFTDLNFDFDGDGILDSHAVFSDLNGDGIPDMAAVDLNGDGTPDAIFSASGQNGMWNSIMLDTDADGIFETQMFDADGDGFMDTAGIDSDRNGMIDRYHSEFDTDHDGKIDTIVDGFDYNQDGIVESQVTYHDADNDGKYEDVMKGHDSDGDGIIDDMITYHDFDGDGNEDSWTREQYFDRDGDGRIDTYIIGEDSDGDRSFDALEVYDIDAETGVIELVQFSTDIRGNISGTYIDDLRNFDPEKVDMSEVSGDPVQSMQEWEYQGNSGRCALYAQKFVIEELTHHDIDIDEMANLAEENGWFNEYSGTALLNMDKILNYYGIHSNMSFHNHFSDLQRELEAGNKVIVSIDSDEIWYGENDDLFTPGDGPNHAVEVIGVEYGSQNNPMIILNDSGNPNGCGEMVPLDVFLDAWEDGNCQMISCMKGDGE